MSSLAPRLAMNDGLSIPAIGYGTGFLDDDSAPDMVGFALDCGYRLLDSAARYGNEAGVGRGVRESTVSRSDIMVTTKLRGSDHGRESTRRALEESLTKLGLDYVDLYLIHWPLPRLDRYVESWETMIAMREERLVRSIGVSNFTSDQLDRLERETGVVPAVNQVERHLEWPQTGRVADDAARHIVTQAWSPLRRAGAVLGDPALASIAAAYDVSPGQVALRWHVQSSVVPIPYSSNRDRVAANLDVFDFELTADDLDRLAALDTGDRFGGDPMTHEEF